LTYTPLIKTSNNSGYTYQPAGEVYGGGAPVVNGTMFVALTDSDMFLTPFNLTMINPHVVALVSFSRYSLYLFDLNTNNYPRVFTRAVKHLLMSLMKMYELLWKMKYFFMVCL
jgi:hypothetical protein